MVEIRNLIGYALLFLFGIVLITDPTHFFLKLSDLILERLSEMTPNNPQAQAIFSQLLLNNKLYGVLLMIIPIYEWCKNRE